MATISQTPNPAFVSNDDEKAYAAAASHRMPGWTVDDLLDHDKPVEARMELECLISAGINSGSGIPMTAEYFEGLRERGRQRARQHG